MAERDPQTTQRDVVPDIAGDLVAAGFTEPMLIGHGGFGAVYRCRQPDLDRTVAIKVLTDHLDEENLERFVREQRAMGRLSGHPHIVNILEVGTTPGEFPFIVMPYHPHDSLDARIRKHGALAWPDVLRLAVKVSGALETAHRSGTLHRDIKPGNILLTEYGEPQLTDFGIARISGGFETDADMVTGSPAFTAPELLSGSAPTVASDIYGLGATLFCALTGHAAFERRSGEQVVAQFLRMAAEPLPDLRQSGIPASISRAVEWAMAREPADRPATAAEYGDGMRAIQRELGVSVDDMALPLETSADPIGGGGGGGSERPAKGGVTTAPPTPSTKFRPPMRPRAQVPRDHLMETLRAGERRRLTLIHAPPGYGKTTVATQWASLLFDEGVRVSWLTVDDDDNDVARFLGDVIEAVRRVYPEVAGDLADVVDDHGAEAEHYVLTSLINEIHARGERVAIVFDDWHRVTDPASIASMDFLLEHGCHHLQVIVTSRTRSGLPVSRMRVRDELVEIDITGLCFDNAEARSFLCDVAGLELHSDEVSKLRDSTDGWAAALQLASVSLRGSETPADLISHISGRHHAIGEFLAENVLSTLEPELLDFLLAVALPERICAGLATALSGEPRGQAMLEDIEARDIFLRRVDYDGDWFRFHPLFLEFLRRRLERDLPESITPLHEAACEWFADHDLLPEAVHHALAAGDTGHAVELVEAGGQGLIEYSLVTTLLGIVDKLPADVVAIRPRIQLHAAWAHLLLRRDTDAAAAVNRAVRELDAAPTIAGAEEMRLEAKLLLACIRATSDDHHGLDELVDELEPRLDDFPPFVASVVANIATISATFRFDFDAAHDWQERAVAYHRENAGPFAVMYGYALDGVAHFEQLHLDRAEECFRNSFRVAVGTRNATRSLGARLASAVLGEVLYERGRTAEATGLLDEAFKLGAEEGVIDMVQARYVIGARLALQRGDSASAAEYLDDGAEIAQRIGAPRLRAFVEAEQVTRQVPARRPIRARVTFADRNSPAQGVDAIVAQLDSEVAIRLLLDTGESTEIENAVRWSREWVDALEGTGRERALLRARRLYAVCAAAAGDAAAARHHAAAVVSRCAAEGMVRFPVDGGAAFRALTQELRSELRAGRWEHPSPPPPLRFLDEISGEQD